MTAYTRPDQIRRKYGDQPSLSPQATPGNADFVDPFRSSNSVLGYAEAGPSTRPADYQPKPVINAVTPATGLAAGGTVVTLTGKNLTGVTSVTFGGVAGTALTVIDDRTVRVTTGAHAAGAVNVVVTSPAGASTVTNGYTYS